MFTFIDDKEDGKIYYDKQTIEGQELYIRFAVECNAHRDVLYFFIYFIIRNNRKKSHYNVSTGKCGIKGLLWAKNKIKEFE